MPVLGSPGMHKWIFGLSPPLGPGTVTRPAPERDPGASACGSHAPAHKATTSAARARTRAPREASRESRRLTSPGGACARFRWEPPGSGHLPAVCCFPGDPACPARAGPPWLGSLPCARRWRSGGGREARAERERAGARRPPTLWRRGTSRSAVAPGPAQSRADPMLPEAEPGGPRAARSRAGWTPCCPEPSRPGRLPRVSSWAGSYPRRCPPRCLSPFAIPRKFISFLD